MGDPSVLWLGRLPFAGQPSLNKQAKRLSLGINAVTAAPRRDGTSQRLPHQKLNALGFWFIAHGADHKLIADLKQGA